MSTASQCRREQRMTDDAFTALVGTIIHRRPVGCVPSNVLALLSTTVCLSHPVSEIAPTAAAAAASLLMEPVAG